MRISDRYPLPEIPREPEISPEAQFAEVIHERTEYLLDYMAGMATNSDSGQKRITSVQSNLSGIDGFTKHAAMLGVLERKGLLDQFYEDTSALRETREGWEVVLEQPLDEKPRHMEQFTIRSINLEPNETGTSHVFALWYRIRKA
jgi:hypothetical protein